MTDFRGDLRNRLAALTRGELAVRDFVTKDAAWDAAHPLPRLSGPDEIESGLLQPLRSAFSGLHRRDIIFIGGVNRRDVGGTWCAAVTHYVGAFTGPLFGLKPSGRLAFLRAGEFYRLEGERVVEAKILFDLPDLIRQAGRFPLPRELGTEMLFPSPATCDGVLPTSYGGAATLDLIEAMIADLHAYDPVTSLSANQTGAGGYWKDDFLWYGPGGIGANYRWDGFVKDHRRAFLRAFPDRRGGNHYCRIGDGAYAAISGWPSMTMTFQGDYLGATADGRALTLRVMDFYRCDGGQIAENWVCLDIADLFRQIGVDLIERSNAL